MVHRPTDLVHHRSLKDPDAFWAEAAATIDWYSRWDRVCHRSRAPFYRWFSGATVNTCYNALDRHVARGRSAQPALIYDSPITGSVATFTYGELLERVSTFAGALARLGVSKGDRVLMCLPMIPEAVVAMLAVRESAPSTRWCSAALRRTSWPRASTMRSRKSS